MKLFLTLVFFSLCLFAHTTPLEKVTLQLNWKYQFEFAGFIAAKEKGFYEDAGLDVDIKEFESNINVIQELKSSKATYVTYDLSLLAYEDNKVPLTLLANYFKRSALVFITQQNILTPNDLKNRTIMANPAELKESTLATLLKKFRISPNEYKLVPHTFDVKDFVSGKVDVISAYVSNELYDIQKAKKAYNILDPLNYGINGMGLNVFATTQEVKNNPDKTQRFIEATNKGWEYALKNKPEIINLIYTKYSMKKSKEALIFEANETEKLIMNKVYKIGEVDISLLEKSVEELLEENVLHENIDIDSMVFALNRTDKKGDDTLFFTPEEKLYLNSKKVITMCIDPDWLPYEKLDKGKHIGMTSEYMKILEDKIGIPIQLVPTQTWTQSIQFAKVRKCDIFSLAAPTPSRKQYMSFTRPYIRFPIVIATRMDQLFISNIKDVINEKPLAIVKDYAFTELLKKKYPHNKLVEVENITEGLNMVSKGNLMGFIGTLATVGYQVQNNYIGELKIAGKFDENLDLGVGVRNDEPQLLNIFNKAIATINEATEQEILNRWISVTQEKSVDIKLIAEITLFFLVVIGLGFYRNQQLKRYNLHIQQQSLELEKMNYELYKTKDKLEKSLNSIELIFECVIEAVFVFENEICIDVNDVAVNMFGYGSKEEMKGLKMISFVHFSSIKDVEKKFKTKSAALYELEGLRKDGSTFYAIAQGSNIILNDKNVRISVLVDISEVKKKEKLLIQQSKMAAMGEMIGNIAHQWRQPLNVISTTTTGMKLQMEYGAFNIDDAKKDLDRLNNTVQHLSQTIDDFRNFFKSEKERKQFSVKDVMLKNINLLAGMFKINQIEVIYGKFEEYTIQSYENEFIQALINILYNAKDVLITKEHNKYIFIDVYKKLNRAIISIKDNGGGIREDVITQIFEPYFTTKHSSHGTGIGLYMTHQIIEEHMQGHIKVQNVTYTYENVSYRGAEFVIDLPLS
ncbi:MAG: ABC transporter substrate-binding protein [Candidatus Marinarcus sp.]|uniref:ABC transporter substrate-binding protein n=1 Tax=Candidatus Marinarcus sp. TaxID=3100987 RepID=UPI003AFFB9D4